MKEDQIVLTHERRKCLRRVAIVCDIFIRNLAYYRGGLGQSALHLQFWTQAHGNFLDVCVLEWCKLFGDRKSEQHCWRWIVADPVAFETGLLARLGMSASAFEDYVEKMRHYRDKFVAHLDSENEMRPPHLSAAQAATLFYYEYLITNEATAAELGLPGTADRLALGYAQCVEEAAQVYRLAGAA